MDAETYKYGHDALAAMSRGYIVLYEERQAADAKVAALTCLARRIADKPRSQDNTWFDELIDHARAALEAANA